MGLSDEAMEHKMNYDYAYSKQFLQGKRITFNRKNPEDMALFDWVNNQPENGNQYIKRLIREDMERRQGKFTWKAGGVDIVKLVIDGVEIKNPEEFNKMTAEEQAAYIKSRKAKKR